MSRPIAKAIASSNRRQLEAMWGAEEALAWAVGVFEQTGKWPSRRFRVYQELASGGRLCSRLLTRATASKESTKRACAVEELIPAFSATKAWHATEAGRLVLEANAGKTKRGRAMAPDANPDVQMGFAPATLLPTDMASLAALHQLVAWALLWHAVQMGHHIYEGYA